MLHEAHNEEVMVKINSFEKYCDDNKIPLFDKSKDVLNLTIRDSTHNIACDFFASEECKLICEEFSKTVRRPKCLFIKSSVDHGKESIQRMMDDEKMDYPVIIKPNASYCGKYSHAKYFINNKDGYFEMYKNTGFCQLDLDIEELVPHSEEMLIKVFCFSTYVHFWKIEPSISESFYSNNSYITANKMAINIPVVDHQCK